MKFPLEESMRMAAGAGYDAIDFLAAAPHAEPREFDCRGRERLRRTADSLKLTINQVATFAPPSSGSYADMDGYVTGQIERLDFAKDVGAGHLEVVPGFRRPHIPAELAWRWAIDAHRRIVDHAEKIAIPVAVECEPQQPTQRMWGRPAPANVHDLDTLARFISEIDSPYCRANLDIGHCNILAKGKPDSIRDEFLGFSGRVVGVHCNDNDGITDLNGVPGTGTCDFGYYLALLKEMGYQGFVSVELEGQEQPEEASTRSLAYLREALNRLRAYG